MLSRFTALLIATLALASLRGQFDAMEPAPVADKLWVMAGYFTILTNLLVAAMMFAVARRWKMSGVVAAGMVVSVALVGLVYHLVLARLWNPEGAAWWADQGLHTAVPLAVMGWWVAFAPKDIAGRDLPKWLIWPVIYCVYALGRGYATGFWPYPFLNADALGLGVLALNIVGLLAVLAALGAGVIGVARLLR
ncbi:MAG: Pr6Pr family membrane protein [Cypionkella sp.]